MLLLWLVKLHNAFQPMGHDWTQLPVMLTLNQSVIRTHLTRRHVLTNTGRNLSYGLSRVLSCGNLQRAVSASSTLTCRERGEDCLCSAD